MTSQPKPRSLYLKEGRLLLHGRGLDIRRPTYTRQQLFVKFAGSQCQQRIPTLLIYFITCARTTKKNTERVNEQKLQKQRRVVTLALKTNSRHRRCNRLLRVAHHIAIAPADGRRSLLLLPSIYAKIWFQSTRSRNAGFVSWCKHSIQDTKCPAENTLLKLCYLIYMMHVGPKWRQRFTRGCSTLQLHICGRAERHIHI